MIRKSIIAAIVVFFAMTSVLQASQADIYPTGKIDMLDFAVFAAAWNSDDSPTGNWNPDCDISDPNDGVIDALDLAVLAAGWMQTAIDEMVWVYIDDSGAGMKDEDGNPVNYGGFTGEMSRYETTNAQYCAFLNAALATGDIIVDANALAVYGAEGSNPGEDFVGVKYLDTNNAYQSSQIKYTGGTFTILTREGYDMSDYPVIRVSWYGATAFCNYYGFALPTEWQWQAVADHNGTFIYGCGTTIDQTKANYNLGGENYCNPRGFSATPYPTPVDFFPPYGYGLNDMAGNVWEWTSTVALGNRVIRGGSWFNSDSECDVSFRGSYSPDITYSHLGFRTCR